MTINVNLTPQLEEMVRQKVASGLYTSASEVVREALRLMHDQDHQRTAKLDRLRDAIQEGLDSGPATLWNPSEMKTESKKRRDSRIGRSQKS